MHEEGGVCRGAVHEKGRVEMRGGGEAAALRPWQDGVRGGEACGYSSARITAC